MSKHDKSRKSLASDPEWYMEGGLYPFAVQAKFGCRAPESYQMENRRVSRQMVMYAAITYVRLCAKWGIT